MAKWAIRYGDTANYFSQMTGIGPAFGATRKKAFTFSTKWEAQRMIDREFPVISSVMANAVRLSR